MAQKSEIPVLRVMQIGEASVDERAHEVERERGAFVAAQQQFWVGLALRRAKARAVDVVAPIARERHAAAGLGVRRTWLGILSGESADADDGLLQPLQQNQAHLQQDLQPPSDVVRLAILEALRAIASLQQKRGAALRPRELGAQRLDFPRH